MSAGSFGSATGGLVPQTIKDVKSIARLSSGGYVSAQVIYTFEWNGRAIAEAFTNQALAALRQALNWAVMRAKQIVHVDTGRLQRSIRALPIQFSGHSAIGTFGSFDVRYAIWHEIGSQGREGVYYIRQAAAEAMRIFWISFHNRGGAGSLLET